jgi:ClpP class serine protease
VLTLHSESSQAAEKAGVKYTVIQAGEVKSAGNPYVPLTEKTRGVLQERVDAYDSQFVGAVARHRGVTAANVEADFGQGKVFLPAEAVKRGMADRVASLETVLAELAQQPAPSSTSPPRKETRPVHKRIKSALYALELIDAVDAADDTCEVALRVFLKTVKAERPKSDDALLSLLAKQLGGSAGESA